MVWSCLRSLKCQHLQRADIEDGKLLSSSMRVRLCFVLSLRMWCNNKLGRSVGEGACSLTIQDQFWINNQLEVIIRIGHLCSLKVSCGPKFGNWKGMQQPCVDQIVKFTLMLLFESNNQLKDGWYFVFNDASVLIRYHLEGAACLVWLKNWAKKLADVGVCFVVDGDLTFEIAEI